MRKKALLVRLGIAALAALAIGALLYGLVLRGHHTLAFRLFGREAELLEPRWLYLLAGLPYLWLVLYGSLSDLSLVQQALGAAVRSVLLTGIALALARPTTVSDDHKVATVVLVDVSASISDRQLAAAQAYLDE